MDELEALKADRDQWRDTARKAEAQLAAAKAAHSKWISERGGIGMAMFDYAADRQAAFAKADEKLVAAIAAAFRSQETP